MAESIDILIAQQHLRLVEEDEFQEFQAWKKAQVKPEEWTLKQFAEHVFNQKGTTRALNYLIKYKNQLDVLRGGFIDYGSTHNGWHIPSHEIQKFIIEHGLN